MRRRGRGFTLVEMVVYMGIFSLVGAGIAATFITGNRWYMQNRAMMSAEGSADIAPRRLTRELIESHLSGITFYPNTTSTSAVPGVVFISPHDPSNDDRFGWNENSGGVQWFKYVCYYAIPDPNKPETYVLMRKQWVPWPNTDPQVNKLPQPCVHDTTWFRDENLPALAIAHNIAPPGESLTSGGRSGFDVFSGTLAAPEYDNVSNPITVRIVTNDSYYSATRNSIRTFLQVSVRN